jgi:hypothetical protein
MPDYVIKEWNESNFDVFAISYTRDAYQHGKYAYVSDYARYYVLYQHGGLYFDTDVELIKPLDDIVAVGSFMGIEKDGDSICVAPGLGLGMEPKSEVCKQIIDLYLKASLFDENGSIKCGFVVKYTTDVLLRHGFELSDRKQTICGITVYPNEYFNPLDDATGRLAVTDNTRSIHWYTKTWADNYGPMRIRLTRMLHRCLGINTFIKLKFLIVR